MLQAQATFASSVRSMPHNAGSSKDLNALRAAPTTSNLHLLFYHFTCLLLHPSEPVSNGSCDCADVAYRFFFKPPEILVVAPIKPARVVKQAQCRRVVNSTNFGYSSGQRSYNHHEINWQWTRTNFG